MKILLLAAVIIATGVFFAAKSWSDVGSPTYVTSDPPAPPPSDNAASYVGSSTHEAFTPYDPGPANSLWKYIDLNADEKAQLDQGRAAAGWDNIHAGYQTVIMEQAQRAAAISAEHELGLLQDSGQIGVVP